MNRAALGLAGLLALSAPAWGDVTGFIGDLVGGKSAAADFAGTWVAAGTAANDIDHVVVTASSSGPVRIQVFGRCEARICNWGALPARLRSDGPTSPNLRSLSADFNLGFALRHITLHRAPGNTLRFDMVTEFTDGSDRHDYETAGQLVPAGTRIAAPPVAPSAAPVPVAGAATPTTPQPFVPEPQTAAPQGAAPQTAASQPAPQPAAPPPAAASAGSGIAALNPLTWFSSKPAAGPQPASQPGPAPEDNSVPVAASTAAPVDDCFRIDTNHVYLTPSNGNWNVRDFLHVVQGFGPYRAAAVKGLGVIAYYRFDEICHIGRGATNMAFFRTAGEVPRQPMGGEECVDVHFDHVMAVNKDDDWKVVDGNREIYDYGSDKNGAMQAASVIKSLALSRQCYYDRANPAVTYWLSR